MATTISVFRTFLCIINIVLISTCVYGKLTADFYATSCPQALSIVKYGIKAAVAKEARIGASLLRLHFHDCFVNGCDGSVLLDDTPTFRGEKTAVPNNRSARGFEVIDKIKCQLEAVCREVVSCADILTLAARDLVVELGGPTWTVPLGRRDSKTASFNGANNNIPPPTSSLSNLISKFRAQGLSTKAMVALAGGHTIGLARCTSFRDHIYNDTDINASFANIRRSRCPSRNGSGNDILSPLDAVTPTCFDNYYYKNLRKKRGLLHSDQELFNGGSTDSQVITYSNNLHSFAADFAAAMVKMGNIKPLTGRRGEIRNNCRRSN